MAVLRSVVSHIVLHCSLQFGTVHLSHSYKQRKYQSQLRALSGHQTLKRSCNDFLRIQRHSGIRLYEASRQSMAGSFTLEFKVVIWSPIRTVMMFRLLLSPTKNCGETCDDIIVAKLLPLPTCYHASYNASKQCPIVFTAGGAGFLPLCYRFFTGNVTPSDMMSSLQPLPRVVHFGKA